MQRSFRIKPLISYVISTIVTCGSLDYNQLSLCI